MLEKGNNQIRVHASLAAAGALKLSGSDSRRQLGRNPLRSGRTLRRPRVLYMSQDPPGTESHLMQTLAAGPI